jgi:hypothetical protein
MNADRELLELAAKAAGIGRLTWCKVYNVGGNEVDCSDMAYVESDSPDEATAYWDPLNDDGDALRLAVKLQMSFARDGRVSMAIGDGQMFEEQMQDFGGDPYAATRRAIVRAAAEIGRTK